ANKKPRHRPSHDPEQNTTQVAMGDIKTGSLGHFVRDRAPNRTHQPEPEQPRRWHLLRRSGQSEEESPPATPEADVQAALSALTRPQSRTHVAQEEDLRLDSLHLRGARLTGADLTNAYLNHTDLAHAFLLGANLTQARLTGANLSEAHLGGAQLAGADLGDGRLDWWPVEPELAAAIIRTPVDLTDASLTKANLRDAVLSGANLSNALLNMADLTGADLTDANLTNTDLSAANLTTARVTADQIRMAQINQWTQLPPHLKSERPQSAG
ncbi:pentapeptide repeat-containing protein, partial [Streptomyces sp. NPDC052015]|uniref:pentapeptide repeat-containing protein n=1 Tax=Streptomyces sp. NPDC052015 TaxID=3154755 RepID=UPI00342002F7